MRYDPWRTWSGHALVGPFLVLGGASALRDYLLTTRRLTGYYHYLPAGPVDPCAGGLSAAPAAGRAVTRRALILGATGSGKTRTALHLVEEAERAWGPPLVLVPRGYLDWPPMSPGASSGPAAMPAMPAMPAVPGLGAGRAVVLFLDDVSDMCTDEGPVGKGLSMSAGPQVQGMAFGRRLGDVMAGLGAVAGRLLVLATSRMQDLVARGVDLGAWPWNRFQTIELPELGEVPAVAWAALLAQAHGVAAGPAPLRAAASARHEGAREGIRLALLQAGAAAWDTVAGAAAAGAAPPSSLDDMWQRLRQGLAAPDQGGNPDVVDVLSALAVARYYGIAPRQAFVLALTARGLARRARLARRSARGRRKPGRDEARSPAPRQPLSFLGRAAVALRLLGQRGWVAEAGGEVHAARFQLPCEENLRPPATDIVPALHSLYGPDAAAALATSHFCAVRLLAHGHAQAARATLRRARRVNRRDRLAGRLLGDMARATGRPALALRYYGYTGWLGRNPHPETLIGVAAALLDLGLPGPAERHARRAVAVLPGRAEAHLNLGLALLARGDRLEALGCVRRALALDRGCVAAWTALGELLLTLGRRRVAANACMVAVALDPNGPTAWRGRGAALGRLGRGFEAHECLRRAVELDPGDAAAWRELGANLVRIGDCDGAVDAFRRAIRLDPGCAQAWSGVASALAARGRAAEAAGYYRCALGIDPGYVEAWAGLGEAYAALGDDGRAGECGMYAAGLAPARAVPGRRALGLVFRVLGLAFRALGFIFRALAFLFRWIPGIPRQPPAARRAP